MHSTSYQRNVPIGTFLQVPIGTSPGKGGCATWHNMMQTAFQAAFTEAFEREGTRIVEIVKGSGVSRSKINKLFTEENRNVAVEDAIAIASFYGKSVEQFLSGQASDRRDQLAALSELLTDEEADLLAAQIKGVVAHRMNESKQQSSSASE